MGLFNKKELVEINKLQLEIERLKANLRNFGALDLTHLQELTQKENEKYKELLIQNKLLLSNIEENQQKLFELSNNVEMLEYGLHIPTYQCTNSEEYANKIKDVRFKQKAMIKDKKAMFFPENFTLDGSLAKGRALTNDNIKMYLRAFNNECETLISKVKFNNYDIVEKRIVKCAQDLDKLNYRNKVSLKYEYLQLKKEELKLVYEYNCIKQEEKEAIRAAREEEREQAKVEKEFEEAKKKILKEQKHYENLKEELLTKLDKGSLPEEEVKSKLEEVESKLGEIDKSLDDIDYRVTNHRVGYVYVISNIGAFGEDVYKIGMTRRQEPLDRVNELGDASVPFKFDVHAMIFSDDAPKLESTLHKVFSKNKLNLINNRKEFFKVSIDEIEKVIKENHDKLVEFIKYPEAQQYRESIKYAELYKDEKDLFNSKYTEVN